MHIKGTFSYTPSKFCCSFTCTEELVGSAEQPVPESNTVDETMFVYYPDRLPSRRQLYYQLCDIKDEKLQELIHSNDGREVECTVCI